MYTFNLEKVRHKAYSLLSLMDTMQASKLRKNLFEKLDEVATGKTIEIQKHGKTVAILTTFPDPSSKPAINLDRIARFCSKYEVSAFYLFGSILRSDFDDESDVDVMIERDSFSDFHQRCRMEEELTSIFQRRVDLVLRKTIDSKATNKHRRKAILSTAQKIFDAQT
jgi:uncharacterized protein